MRKLLKVLGAVVVCLVLLLVTLRATGLEPTLCDSAAVGWQCRAPGLWLRGDVVTAPVTDWSFTDKIQTIKLETREWFGLPHSVSIYCFSYNGELYVTSVYRKGIEYPHGRHWNENVARDPRVRLKIGDKVYERTLLHVTDPALHDVLVKVKAKKYSRQVIGPNSYVNVFHVVDPRVTN